MQWLFFGVCVCVFMCVGFFFVVSFFLSVFGGGTRYYLKV